MIVGCLKCGEGLSIKGKVCEAPGCENDARARLMIRHESYAVCSRHSGTQGMRQIVEAVGA